MKNAPFIVLALTTMIKNVVAVAAFTYLAIYFNHWWIALFSMLIVSEFKFKQYNSSDKEELNIDEKGLS